MTDLCDFLMKIWETIVYKKNKKKNMAYIEKLKIEIYFPDFLLLYKSVSYQPLQGY